VDRVALRRLVSEYLVAARQAGNPMPVLDAVRAAAGDLTGLGPNAVQL
jgi:hypothetical protein